MGMHLHRKSPYIYIIFLALFFLPLFLLAQRKPGNEWIVYGQKYYKIKIGQSGMYRINYAALAAAGMDMSSIDDRKFQLFFRGQEVPVLLNEKTPGSFSSGDYIQFYGQRNDGALDAVLYNNPADQPHTDYSIFTDTSAYFLTLGSSTANKRIQRAVNTGSGANGATYMYDAAVYLHEYFSYNTPLSPVSLNYNNSEYTEGMGWMSGSITTRSKKTITVSTPDFNGGGGTPQLEFLLYSKSEATGSSGNDHHLQIVVTGSNGTRTFDYYYRGFQKIFKTESLSGLTLDKTTTVDVIAVGVTPGQEQLERLSYVKITYPRTFAYDASASQVNQWFSITNSGNTNDFSFAATNSGSTKYLALYDISQGILSETRTVTNTAATFNLPNPGHGKSDFFLFDTTFINSVSLTAETFTQPDLNGVNYLLIAGKQISGAATRFASYKETQKIDSFNNFKVLTAYAEDLYDQFFYGVHHAAAIQNFLAYIYKTQAGNMPKFLLLFGKGISNDSVRQSYNHDIVPSIGFPSSDLMYMEGVTTGFNGRDKIIKPLLAIGRLAVISETEADNYLEKLQVTDSSFGKAPWEKRVIHITGGEPQDQVEMRRQLNQAKNVIEGEYTGAKVTTFNADNNNVVFRDLKTSIQSSINSGAGLLTYLGHGSLNQLGVDIGDFDKLSNKGKYPIMYLNGCTVGNPSFVSFSLGGQYLFAKQKGAINWISQSNTALVGVVEEQIRLFYNNIAISAYGKTVGETWQKTIEDLQTEPDATGYLRSGTEQVVLQGDPSVRMPYPIKPDFALYDSTMFISPRNVVASTPSYSVAVPVYNLGETFDGSIKLTVRHTLPDGLTKVDSAITIPAPKFCDTVYVTLNRGSQKLQGLNKFDIGVNQDTVADEVTWDNNTAHFEFLFPGTGSRALIPTDFGIEHVDTPALVVQSRNLLDKNTGFIYEIDTTPYFNSPIKKTSPLIKGSSVMTWKPQLMVRNALGAVDSVVYYWRVRMNLPADSGGDWDVHSFTYINKSSEGWSQSHFPQYSGIVPEAVIVDTVLRKFSFIQRFLTYTLSANAFSKSGLGVKQQGQGVSLTFGTESGTTLIMVEVDRTTLEPVDSDRVTHVHYSSGNYHSGIEYLQFNTNLQSGLDSLKHSINRVPDGNYVLLVSRDYPVMGLKTWNSYIYSAFQQIGDTMIPHLHKDSTAFIIAGIKGTKTGRLIQEMSRYYPKYPDNTVIQFDAHLSAPAVDSGYLNSTIIGPAQKWKTMYQVYKSDDKPTTKDTHFMQVYGIDSNGGTKLLFDSVRSSSLKLDTINAVKYPYLKLRAELEDDSLKTPPQLKMWQVTYTGLPEGSIVADNDFAFKSDTLTQGDTLYLRIKYKNVSSTDMKPVHVAFSMRNAGNNELLSAADQSGTYAALKAGEYFTIEKKLSTKNMSGQCIFSVKVNPNFQQPELTLDNNILNIPVYVIVDKANPVLDVTIDGKHVLNGEVVSPTPAIVTTVWDDNKLLALNDTSDFRLTFRNISALKADTVYMSDKRISFKGGSSKNDVATIIFSPGPLGAGTYEFSAQARDRSNNYSGTSPFYTTFNVAPDAGISNIYVFPNPLLDKARFVYTLSGSQVPDFMELRIYNIEGQLVRTLTKADMKNPSLGQNEFDWDGRNDGGAPLMQGVYFYKMIVQQGGKNVNNTGNSQEAQVQVGNGKLLIIH